MASSGDPSSFTFTMDAFPDYTRFDKTKKVLAAIQIIEEKTDDDIDDGSNNIDADKTYYETSKVISRKRENPMFKTLAKLDNTKYDLAKVSVFDYDGSDDSVCHHSGICGNTS